VIFKNLLKSSLDNYVLPGTLTGTEILWIYLIQWKRHIVTVIIASFCVFLSSPDGTTLERVESNVNDQ